MFNRESSRISAISVVMVLSLAVMIFANVQSHDLLNGLASAAQQAGASFDAKHPFNAATSLNQRKYQAAARTVDTELRPLPDWKITDCEVQTLDHRDYEIDVAKQKVKGPWPISWMTRKRPLPAPEPYTSGCQAERSAFAAKQASIAG